MKKYRIAVGQAYILGDLKAYVLLVTLFWAVVLQFKNDNRCRDLSTILSSTMSEKIANALQNKLRMDEGSIIIVGFNLLCRPNGLMSLLGKNGWKISAMNEERIQAYRTTNGVKIVEDIQHLNETVRKVGKHANKVIKWSSNKTSNCLIM